MRKWFTRGPSKQRWRLPDFKSLHTRWLFGLGSLLTALALLALTVLYAQEKRAHRRVELGRAEAVASSVATWLNGDTHAKLVQDYAVDSLADWEQAPREMVEMCDVLRRTANGLDARIRTVRIKDGLQQLVEAESDSRHPKALELILTNEDKLSWRRAIDYVPEMAPAFFASESASAVSDSGDGGVHGYAPVLDAWDGVVAVTVVEAKAPGSALFVPGLIAIVATGALLFLVVKVLGYFLRRHSEALTELATQAERLLADHRMAPVTTSASSRELLRLADALEASRAGTTGGAPRAAAASAPAAPAPRAPLPATNGRASRNGGGLLAQLKQSRRPDPTASLPGTTFDVPLLIDQAVEPSRQKAAQKKLELRVIVGEKVPAQVESDPAAILAALTTLLDNAIRYTREGAVAVQINRVVDADQLRFEVRDTGLGVAWKAQPRLSEALELAKGQEPADARPGLQRTAAVVARLGGEIGFDSQPGSGTRFWFTAPYEPPPASQLESPEAALAWGHPAEQPTAGAVNN